MNYFIDPTARLWRFVEEAEKLPGHSRWGWQRLKEVVEREDVICVWEFTPPSVKLFEVPKQFALDQICHCRKALKQGVVPE